MPTKLNTYLLFQKGLSEEKSVYDWTNKEKSKSLDKPSYSKKEEKEKDKKDNKLSGSCDIESESRDKRSSNRGKLGTNEMLESDNPPPEYNKQDCMVIGLDDFEVCIDRILKIGQQSTEKYTKFRLHCMLNIRK